MNDPKINEILKHFPGWRLDPRYRESYWAFGFIDAEGHGLHFNTTHRKGRFVVSGCWPQNGQYVPSYCPHITVSKDRPAEKIADDIKRRLLLDYFAEFAKIKERIAAQNKYQASVDAVRQDLANLIGGEQGLGTLHGPGRTQINVESPDSVRLLCYCTSAAAKKILAILRSL